MSLPTRIEALDRRRALTWPPAMPDPIALDNAADVLALVALAVREAQTDMAATPMERARTLGALAGVALKAIEARDLAARVEALERVLKQRKERR